MIWLTGRQHRTEGFVTLALLAMIGVALLITGLNMAHSFQDSGLSACLAHHTDRSVCGPLVDAFGNHYRSLIIFSVAPLLLPALLGALVGAPLVAREYEQRTQLLAWMQSVSRTRWLTVKLAVVLGAGAVAAGALLALMIWWYGPFAQLTGTFSMPQYDFSGPVLIGAMVMALALGAAAGTLTRRTVPAILLTLALFLVVRGPIEVGELRAYFEPPITVTWPLELGDNPPVKLDYRDWVIDDGFIDAQGHISSSLRCTEGQTIPQCAQADGYHARGLIYQPADRFWSFQWIETGIYLVIAALAIAVTALLVRRRQV